VTSAIRKRLWKDKDLGELARDIDDALALIPTLKIKKFDAPYTEPLDVGYDHAPELVLCRIRRVSALETPTLTGGFCHFVWDGVRSRIRINSIDGMTPEPGVIYRFTFMMVG
jgi:hypothetical protein